MNRRPTPSALTSPFARAPRHQPKQVKAAPAAPVDETPTPDVQSGFSVFNPIPVEESMMSKVDAEKITSPKLDAEARAAAKAAKAAKLAAKTAEREAAAQAKEAAKAERAAARAAAKAEREARLAEAGPQGKMFALRDAKKNYVKSATGQLRTNDELAQTLDAVPPTGVIRLALEVLQLSANPYSHLNVGQQSMNLRNKLRGAIKRNVVTITQVVKARDAGGYALTADDLAKRTVRKAKEQSEVVAA